MKMHIKELAQSAAKIIFRYAVGPATIIAVAAPGALANGRGNDDCRDNSCHDKQGTNVETYQNMGQDMNDSGNSDVKTYQNQGQDMNDSGNSDVKTYQNQGQDMNDSGNSDVKTYQNQGQDMNDSGNGTAINKGNKTETNIGGDTTKVYGSLHLPPALTGNLAPIYADICTVNHQKVSPAVSLGFSTSNGTMVGLSYSHGATSDTEPSEFCLNLQAQMAEKTHAANIKVAQINAGGEIGSTIAVRQNCEASMAVLAVVMGEKDQLETLVSKCVAKETGKTVVFEQKKAIKRATKKVTKVASKGCEGPLADLAECRKELLASKNGEIAAKNETISVLKAQLPPTREEIKGTTPASAPAVAPANQ